MCAAAARRAWSSKARNICGCSAPGMGSRSTSIITITSIMRMDAWWGTSIITTRMKSTPMFGDFFSRALIAGVGLAGVTGPLGCFVVWRRMAYFGDTMAHSALLGVALSILLSVNMTLGVFAVAALVAGALIVLQKQATLSTDALLGILSHSTLAVGLVLVGF